MSGPEKPFSCLKFGCGESFTNEDRLAVHAKKHDMELQLGPKGEAFVADQTPTPTRFIRNCEEVGLFQDLQNVNPFEETFKRAIESRSSGHNLNLDGNLTVSNPDDTLHTPHIFPNLSEDSGTVIYSTNADNTERSPLGVQRSSSDESNSQLSVVRCLSSSVDDGLPHISVSNKSKRNNISASDEVKTIHKSFSSSKVKLRRQESIDLPDDISDVPILNTLISVNGCKDENVNVQSHSEITVIETSHQARNSQIPVISISEIPKSDTNEDEDDGKKKGFTSNLQSTLSVPKESNVECLKPENKTYLNVSSCIKNNYTKLISQKSIEMALANFTNEAQTKLVDLNNISIEDIPENSSIMRENSKGDNNTNVDVSRSPCNPPRQLIFVQNKQSNSKEDSIDRSIPTSSVNKPNTTSNSVPVIEINENVASVDTQKGYELILKWPDGKQIYLKEMNKEDHHPSSSSQSKPQVNEKPPDVEKNVINNNVKRKLKDMISINAKKLQTDSTCNTHSNQVTFNSIPVQNIVVPGKYIFLPINEPKISLATNIISAKEPQLHPREVTSINTIPQPVIRTVLNGKICEGTNTLLPVNNQHLQKAVTNKIAKKHVVNKTVKSTNVLDPEEDPVELKKRGNRAAVLRYRLRRKQKQKYLIERNELLEKKNKELSDLLKLAYADIEFLRKKFMVKSENTVLPEVHTDPSHVTLSVLRERVPNEGFTANLSLDKPTVIFKK